MPDQLTTLDDGQLHFKIRNRGTGEETDHSIDVLLLRLTCEECETAHNLEVYADGPNKGQYKATAAFLNDLTNKLAAMGVTGCTASIALQLWNASVAEIDSLKKNTSETLNSLSGSECNQEPSPSENVSGY